MVNIHGMISIGVDIKPEIFNKSEWKDKTVSIGVDYKITMADIIIKVSDHDQENIQEPIFNQNYQLFEHEADTQDTPSPITISRNSRPICRSRRSDSNKSSCSFELDYSNTSVPSIPPNSLKPCEYYRQKYFFNKDGYDGNPNIWANYSALQKSAGQKVINKIAAQQKRLEAEAIESKRNGTIENSLPSHQAILQPKKRPAKLEPLKRKIKLST